jgi:hypothetical protein
MNRPAGIALIAGTLLWCAATTRAHSQESTDAAMLRCDPHVLIYKIDGKSDTHGSSSGSSFKDCAIALSAGSHTLEVCYDASSQSMTTQTIAVCDKPKEIAFEAAAARAYRLKVRMGGNWSARVVDVTEEEAGYSYAERPRPSRPASKAERTSTLILQVSPQYGIPRFYRGKFLGPWFVPSRLEHKAENTGVAKAAPDGFVVVEADAGDNLTITSVRLLVGSVFMPKQYFACDDYQSRIFENIAGGKVLYLGHLRLAGGEYEQKVSWTDDIDDARQYVESHLPKLSGKLEPAAFTTRRIPDRCALYPRALTNSP